MNHSTMIIHKKKRRVAVTVERRTNKSDAPHADGNIHKNTLHSVPMHTRKHFQLFQIRFYFCFINILRALNVVH